MVPITYFENEILKGYNIAKKLKGSYSTLADRSEYVIKTYKNLNNSEDIHAFKEALKKLIKKGDNDFIDFVINVLVDGISFGNLID